MRTLSVLLVDDDADYLGLVAGEILYKVADNGLGPIEILLALSLEEGLALARAAPRPPEIIVLDGLFPGTTFNLSLGLTQQILTEFNSAVCIGNSASAMLMAALRQAGCQDSCSEKDRLPDLICRYLCQIRKTGSTRSS